jgi:hypothetical protein
VWPLVNYAYAPILTCSECPASLLTIGADGGPAAAGLAPCEDCKLPVSRRAESCHHCGMFYRDHRRREPGRERGRGWWVFTIALSVGTVAVLFYWLLVAFSLLTGQ